MTDTTSTPSARLDSWKAIAAYLQRDERTVQRWEREVGLPVRRLPGGRGRSVFAYAHELDAWLTAADRRETNTSAVIEADERSTALPTRPTGWSGPVRPSGVKTRALATAAVLVVGVAAAVAWRLGSTTVSAADLHIAATNDGVLATDGRGARQWQYRFPPEYRTGPAEEMGVPVRVAAGTRPAVYVATAYRDRQSDGVRESGALAELDLNGTLQRTFSFDDIVTLGQTAYGPPWIVTTFAIDDSGGSRRIAIAAHHAVWDASLVTVIDSDWRRRGTFVHAGWINDLDWLAPNRLLVAGFSNAHDGGMVALLDPTLPGGVDGQGPEPADSPYYCHSCAPGAPLRVVIMPRTDLNRATASLFNRARVEVSDHHILARTIEVPTAGGAAADALYEFTMSLDLVRASFGDHYQDVRRMLEARGQLAPSRAAARTDDRPREIDVWDPRTGWRVQAIR